MPRDLPSLACNPAERDARSSRSDRTPATPFAEGLQELVDRVALVALPLWAARRDASGLPFAERLDLAGESDPAGYLRLRVMARQTAVYAAAAHAGHRAMLPIAETGWIALERQFWSTVTGWASRVGHHGQVIDPAFELYDQAFAVYACARWAEASGSTDALQRARRSLVLIDRRLRLRDLPGWRSRAGCPGRDQNGHMHYLEALLVLHAVDPGPHTASRIDELLALAAQRLFDSGSGTIPEWFDDLWRANRAPALVEPGHQYEWVWLLGCARRQGFRHDLPEDRLLAFAERQGWSRRTGLIYDSCAPAGQPLSHEHRLWPHCEAIRAWTLQPDASSRHRAETIATRLIQAFLDPALPGGWIDRLGPSLEPRSVFMPATSLYHLWEAASAIVAAGWARWPWSRPC